MYDIYEDYRLINDIKEKVRFVEGDVLDLDKVIKVIKKNEVKRIIHTVALLSMSDPKMSLKVNTEGMVNVLWTSMQCEVERVVYTSSKAVYNEVIGKHAHPDYVPINENYAKDEPMGIYGATKFYGELVGNQFFRHYGVDFVSLRFSTIYGPGRLLKNPDSPMVLPCRIIESGMLGRPFKCPKGREQKDGFIYIDDVGYGVSLACFAGSLRHRAFNIGTEVASGLMDFANAVGRIYPGFEADIGPGLDHAGTGFISYSVYDISRAREELGYRPRYDIDAGVSDYIEQRGKLCIQPTFVE